MEQQQNILDSSFVPGSSGLYVDSLLPKERDRIALRARADRIIENVVVGFDSMLDQLGWMSADSKREAAKKVANLVRNIAFPEWIMDDALLTAHLDDFPLQEEDSFTQSLVKISRFNRRSAFEPLADEGHTNRVEFNGLPMVVNAWYQPQLNSITFPLAILTPFFESKSTPSAIHYGILGAIAGHELTHGFDDSGTQFDGFGKLRPWMDPKSMNAFERMTECVIEQYAQFCPLPEEQFSPNCIDGFNTQGENVADNGGLRAAYRAYRNAMNFRGDDLALPDPLVGQYDHDQLFFLSFAQTWCQMPVEQSTTVQQLLLDPHSPSKYRVLGTLQNFAAFQNAFHCPKGSAYAPPNHCNVWVSDVKLTNGEPSTPLMPSLNLPKRETEQSDKFKQAAAYFESSVDNEQDPCNNFYEYACNAFDGESYSDKNSVGNLIALAKSMKQEIRDQIEPIEKAKLTFRKCEFMMGDGDHFNRVLEQTDLPRQVYDLFREKTKLDFPLFVGAKQLDWPSRDQLSTAIGVLGGSLFVDSFVSAFVDINWKDPDSNTMPYALFIDQPTLAFSPLVYSPDHFPHYRDMIGSVVEDALVAMAKHLNVDSDWNDVNSTVQDVIDFECALANSFVMGQRQDMDARYNLFTLQRAQEQFPSISWPHLLRELSAVGPTSVQQRVQQPDFRFVLMEPGNLAGLLDALKTGNTHKFTANQMLNYLYCQLILEYVDFIPGDSQNASIPLKNQWRNKSLKYLGDERFKLLLNDRQLRYRPPLGPAKQLPQIEPKKSAKLNDSQISDVSCAEFTLAIMDSVSGRMWLDHALPTYEMRSQLISGAEKVVNSLLLSFRSMVQQISWMSPQAKAAAFRKLDGIVVNLGWPELVVNNTLLEEYYTPLDFTEQDNFLDIWMKGTKLAHWRQWEHLQKRHGADSVKYGAIGVVLGHELSRGFDNGGVQWDSEGVLDGWLDTSSQAAFDQMAQCVADEYAQFCPFPVEGSVQPACINGNRTRDRNVADSGGLHAAFRAYRAALEVEGPSKGLPGNLVGQFSHDQLFFLSFAQPWCRVPNDFATWLELAGGGLSPPKYRVLGSIRNMPVFREAFNCPVGSNYAPKEHCQVWVSPVADQREREEEETPRSGLNFERSIDLSADPCNSFYEYACGQYQGPKGFAIYRADNYRKIGDALQQLKPRANSALEKLKNFQSACITALASLDAKVADGAVVKNKVDTFRAYTGLEFPLFSDQMAQMPKAETLAKAMAWLSAKEGVDTLFSPFVDVELAAGEQGQSAPKHYRLFIDQNTLAYSKSYYLPGTWELIRDDYAKNVLNLLARYAAVLGKPLDEVRLNDTTEALLKLELRLAREFSTDENTRRDYGRWAEGTWQSLDTANKMVPSVDWGTYLTELSQLSGVYLNVADLTKQFAYFVELDRLKALSGALLEEKSVHPDELLNYLFFRILLQNADFLPQTKANGGYLRIMGENNPLNRPVTSGPSHPLLRRYHEREDPFERIPRQEDVRVTCAAQSALKMQMASARVFTELLYPSAEERRAIRKSVSKLVQGVRHSYRGMLNELDWLDGRSRDEALAKVENLQVNLGWPDWILADSELDAYFGPLHLIAGDSYFSALDKLTVFNNFLQYRLLQTEKFNVDRANFVGPPATVNAWYAPELNSITFPEGIIRQPYFNPMWPTSVNYGALGIVAGHELSHAFDDGGVQWDSLGVLRKWMSGQSQTRFNQMAQCVVDEYSGFRVLNPDKFHPSNISGSQTQGENIADNAGMIAAYRAYKMHMALNGPDPRLPDPTLSGLSHDQLFFLSFAQTWCQSPPTEAETFRQILIDPHSPSKYRVLGSIQNFPAFRAAFNCPANSAYVGEHRCHVWVPENADF